MQTTVSQRPTVGQKPFEVPSLAILSAQELRQRMFSLARAIVATSSEPALRHESLREEARILAEYILTAAVL